MLPSRGARLDVNGPDFAIVFGMRRGVTLPRARDGDSRAPPFSTASSQRFDEALDGNARARLKSTFHLPPQLTLTFRMSPVSAVTGRTEASASGSRGPRTGVGRDGTPDETIVHDPVRKDNVRPRNEPHTATASTPPTKDGKPGFVFSPRSHEVGPHHHGDDLLGQGVRDLHGTLDTFNGDLCKTLSFTIFVPFYLKPAGLAAVLITRSHRYESPNIRGNQSCTGTVSDPSEIRVVCTTAMPTAVGAERVAAARTDSVGAAPV